MWKTNKETNRNRVNTVSSPHLHEERQFSLLISVHERRDTGAHWVLHFLLFPRFGHVSLVLRKLTEAY